MFQRSSFKLALVCGATALSSACTTLPSFSEANYVSPMDGASVVENRTRYSQSLECLRPFVGTSTAKNLAGKRFAVGRVSDFTGKEDLTNGKRITQGAALMVISALAKSGVPIVERFDTSIADIELKYADNKLISDDPESKTHRRILSGSLPGSDYHIVGGITEVNYNIRSGSLDASVRFIGLAARYFVMNVAIDLRLVNTKTLEVVNTQSLQKQIIGTELSGGYFRLFSDGRVDINAAERTQEPIQKGVRMVIEQAVFNMLTEVETSLPAASCQHKTLAAQTLEQATEPKAAVARNTTLPISPTTASPTAVSNRANTSATIGAGNISVPSKATNTTTVPLASTEAVNPIPASTAPVQTNLLPNTNALGKSSKVAEEKSQPMNNKSNEVQLKGLFGTEPAAPVDQQTTSNNTREMQEKILWGNRAVIR